MPSESPNDDTIPYEPPDSSRPASSAPTEHDLESEIPGGSQSAGHDPYLALRFRDYRLFSIGFMVAVIGGQMLSVAIGWEIYNRTGKPSDLGMVGLVQALPVILFSLLAGQAADRFNRKQLLLLMQFLTAGVSLALAWVSHIQAPLWAMYLLLFMLGLARTFTDPVRSAIFPHLVPRHAFENAVTWSSSVFQIAAMTGPMIGGFLIAVLLHVDRTHGFYFAYPIVYAINAGTALFFLVFVVMLKSHANTDHKEPVTLRTVGAGLQFVFNTKIILATITLDLFAVLLGGAVALLPVYAKDILHTDSTGLGWLRAAPSIGAFSMALIMAHRPPMKRAGLTMLFAVAGFGAATVVFGLSHWFWLSILMLVVTGALDNISVVVRHTLVQVLTPDAMRGRVSAVNSVFIGASNELGEFESGYSAWGLGKLAAFWRGGLSAAQANTAGTVLSVVLGGIGSILVVMGVNVFWPEVRKFGALTAKNSEG